MDNASFHKREDIFDAIDEHGGTLEFLPPYSPDLNPIEKKWTQVKVIEELNAVVLMPYLRRKWIMPIYIDPAITKNKLCSKLIPVINEDA